MEFGFTEEQQRLRAEVRDFVAKEVPPEMIEECKWGREGRGYRELLPKIGAKGWLCPTWAREYGGLEASHVDQIIIHEDLGYHWVFSHEYAIGALISGPIILNCGSEELKERFLLPIARGEIEFALGYTEPQAGSDLASLEIRAVEDGDDFILSGQKVFNTGCHLADYHWLLARTDPNATPRYRGFSLMIVDLKSPGITIRPLWTIAGWRTNEVFYDDVRVPKANLVGEKNRGWYYVMSALDLERIRVVSLSEVTRCFDEIVNYVSSTKVNGQPLSKEPLVRRRLAQMAIELEVARLLLYRTAWMLDNNLTPNYESALTKTFISELWQRQLDSAMEILGPYGPLRHGSRWSQMDGLMRRFYEEATIVTVGAGTSEICRNIIALRGLGLPVR